MTDSEQQKTASAGSKSRLASITREVFRITLFVLIAAAAIWLWKDVLEDRLIPKRWGTVEAGRIYRSGRLSAALVGRTLRKYDIAVIVDLTADSPGQKDQDAEKQAAAELGIERFNFPLRGDGTGDINNYARAIAAIVHSRQKGKPVLVHCAAGAQRTGGVVAAYRMLIEKKPPSLAYAELSRYGWRARSDQILLTYVNTNIARLAELLKQMGIIDEVPNPLPVIGDGDTAKHQVSYFSPTVERSTVAGVSYF